MNNAMKKIRAGVIGVGYLGRFHAQKYASMEGVELVGIADIDPRQAQRVAEECSCASYDDHRALLRDIDAVSIVRAHQSSTTGSPRTASPPGSTSCSKSR